MGFKKRLAAVVLLAAVSLLTFGIARSGMQVSEKQEEEFSAFTGGKDTLYLWYTDEALTSYLTSAAVIYNESHDVRIVPVLQSGLEYLEQINAASLSGEEMPDLYVLSHDSLEKAYLAGLAEEIKLKERTSLRDTYRDTGLYATTYQDKVIGYPFYFETSALLYNKTYLEDLAESQLQAEVDAAAGEEAQQQADAGNIQEDTVSTDTPSASGSTDDGTAGGSSNAAAGDGQAEESTAGDGNDEATAEAAEETFPFSEEEIEARVQELLPKTLEDMETFADSYDAPEAVEGVFKWDVTDVFYNYFFIGNAIKMGGKAGDDTSQIDIYNLNAIRNMRAYEELNQFFSIDTSEISYESVISEFMEGKQVFTVATSDVVNTLEQARADGSFSCEYGIALLPDIDADRETKPLSMTQCVVVNGYGTHQEDANDFAFFLTARYNDSLYTRSGKVSAARDVDYGNEALSMFAEAYDDSVAMPKMIETSNFWVLLERVFSQVWDGTDANDALKELSEQIMQQVTGQEYEEVYIEDVQEESDVEYLDEEYYTEEVQSEGQAEEE